MYDKMIFEKLYALLFGDDAAFHRSPYQGFVIPGRQVGPQRVLDGLLSIRRIQNEMESPVELTGRILAVREKYALYETVPARVFRHEDSGQFAA